MGLDGISGTIRIILEEELRPLREEIEALKAGTMKLCSVKAAAKSVGVSADTVLRWIARGQLRRYGSGRIIRVEKRAVLALMEPGKDKDSPACGDSKEKSR